MKILKIKNKGIVVFDSVRFITSVEAQRFSFNLLRELQDYRVVITHGVIGELLNLIENSNFGIDIKKIHLLVNNLETAKLFNNHGYSTYDISEYIFTDDDRYNIIETTKKYDCVFPGRPTKVFNLFQETYRNNLNLLYKSEKYPYRSEDMPTIFNQAKTGLMTTESEGSCLSVGEMLCCGIPVVSVKINNTVDKLSFYPSNKNIITHTYGIILPHTLGGRELWLDSTNSIYCKRQDDAIDEAITSLKNLSIPNTQIRKNFLSKLSQHRLKFLYLIKSLAEELEMDFYSIRMEDFINLPYGNSSLSTTEWKNILDHFKSSYIK